MLEQSLSGVEYFQSYYQYWLLSAVALSMIGWIFFLVQAPVRTGATTAVDVNLTINKGYSYFGFVGVVNVLVFVYRKSFFSACLYETAEGSLFL